MGIGSALDEAAEIIARGADDVAGAGPRLDANGVAKETAETAAESAVKTGAKTLSDKELKRIGLDAVRASLRSQQPIPLLPSWLPGNSPRVSSEFRKSPIAERAIQAALKDAGQEAPENLDTLVSKAVRSAENGSLTSRIGSFITGGSVGSLFKRSLVVGALGGAATATGYAANGAYDFVDNGLDKIAGFELGSDNGWVAWAFDNDFAAAADPTVAADVAAQTALTAGAATDPTALASAAANNGVGLLGEGISSAFNGAVQGLSYLGTGPAAPLLAAMAATFLFFKMGSPLINAFSNATLGQVPVAGGLMAGTAGFALKLGLAAALITGASGAFTNFNAAPAGPAMALA